MPAAAPTPDGPYTVPLAELAVMVSECAAFQTRCGLTYPDAAAEAKLVNGDGGAKHIYYPALEGEDWLDRLPACIITWGDSWRLGMFSGGARNYFHGPDGELILELIDVDRQSHEGAQGRMEAATRDFGNFIGRVLSGGAENTPGLAELAALNDRLAINEIAQLEGPMLCDRIEGAALGKTYYTARFSIRYGLSR